MDSLSFSYILNYSHFFPKRGTWPSSEMKVSERKGLETKTVDIFFGKYIEVFHMKKFHFIKNYFKM